MEEILLKDICDLDNGYAFRSDDYVESSDTLNCRMSNIRPDGAFDILYSAKYLPDEFAEKYEDYLLNDGDLIIAMTDMAGDPKILGVPTVVDTKGYKLLLNQRVGKLRFIKPGVNADYLKLALQSKRVREYLKRFAGGGVQLNVSKKDILNAPVRMRTEEEQNYIADLFRRVLEIKKQREHELLCLDNLIKARFVEFFGIPLVNNRQWEIKKIGDIVTDVRYGTSRPAVDGGKYPYLRMNNLTNDGYLDLTNLKYIDVPENEIEKCIVRKGDVLFNRTNSVDLVGKTALFDLNEEMIIAGYIIRVRLKDCILPEVFSQYMNMEPVKDLLHSIAKGAVNQANINAQELQSIEIYIPDMDKQNEYIAFKKQIDKSKVVVQKSINEAQLLFDSLMQKYFG